MVNVGVAKADITPPVGTWLVGYLDRVETSKSIATPLQATALAIESGGEWLVIISCELLAVHPRLIAEIRQQVSSATVVPKHAIWVSATHTHSGPPSETTDQSNAVESDYAASLASKIAATAVSALASVRPARLQLKRTEVSVAHNRRHIVDGAAVMEPAPGRPLDREFSLLVATGLDGATIATLAIAACHPVTVGRDNLTVGGDYPGRLCRMLEERFGGIALFVLGAAGDANPNHGPVPDQSGAEQVARLLDTASSQMRSSELPIDAPLVVASQSREFPVSPSRVDRGPDKFPFIDHLLQLQGLGWRGIDLVMDRRHPWHPAASGDYHKQDVVPGEIAAARIGSIALVALPFEVFAEIGFEIKRRSPFATTLILSQTNGALGYLAPAAEHPLGGYEINESSLFYRTRGPLSPQATEIATSVSIEMLETLAGAGPL